MTDDRSLERAARAFIEVGPSEAPDRAVEAALLRIQTTSQERDLIPWRLPIMNPLLRLAAAVATVAVVAVAGATFILPGGGPGGEPSPNPSPSPSVSATPLPIATPRPFTGACTLVTSDEAEEIAGIPGLGAIPFETGEGAVTSCRYADGGGNTVLRLTWTKVGGAAVFDAVRSTPDVEAVTDIGEEALYDPATHTLHVRSGDALVVITAGGLESTPAQRRLAGELIGQLVADRM